ncbi:CLUMA_CG018515, isoform A [Clunio marinus]|uniref:CLUMA_CG018515, isoform A n=1 Tax=Clunio marinus TaxID=568069 RepID=A0A1J1IYB7_9DIPT|nr:CLUMA_CG018515, isoform A [Clunio marinus]
MDEEEEERNIFTNYIHCNVKFSEIIQTWKLASPENCPSRYSFFMRLKSLRGMKSQESKKSEKRTSKDKKRRDFS